MRTFYVFSTPTIPRALEKKNVDSSSFNAFLARSCREMYTNIYQNRSFGIIEDIPILELFAQLDWIPLASFIGTAYAKIVHLFYSNIIDYYSKSAIS